MVVRCPVPEVMVDTSAASSQTEAIAKEVIPSRPLIELTNQHEGTKKKVDNQVQINRLIDKISELKRAKQQGRRIRAAHGSMDEAVQDNKRGQIIHFEAIPNLEAPPSPIFPAEGINSMRNSFKQDQIVIAISPEYDHVNALQIENELSELSDSESATFDTPAKKQSPLDIVRLYPLDTRP